MALPSLARQTVIRQRAQTSSDHGATVPDWGKTPDELEIPGCMVQPGSTNQENNANRTASSSSTTVWLPPGADVNGSDHVLIAGITRPMAVIGDPELWTGYGLRLEHMVLHLEVWEG